MLEEQRPQQRPDGPGSGCGQGSEEAGDKRRNRKRVSGPSAGCVCVRDGEGQGSLGSEDPGPRQLGETRLAADVTEGNADWEN